MFKIISIFNSRDVRTENSVTSVTTRRHEACRVMPNSYPGWRNFQFAPNNHYWFFFLHTLPLTFAFMLEFMLFYQFYAEITIFFLSSDVRFGSYLRRWYRNVCRKTDVNMTSKSQRWCQNAISSSWRHAQESSYTRERHFLAPVGFTEIPVGYASNLWTPSSCWIFLKS